MEAWVNWEMAYCGTDQSKQAETIQWTNNKYYKHDRSWARENWRGQGTAGFNLIPDWLGNCLGGLIRGLRNLDSDEAQGRSGTRRVTCPYIQLFREKLSEKVHAAIPKGIMGGFDITVLQWNLKEWHERPWTYVCECYLMKGTKVGSTATVSRTVYWSYPILPFGIVACKIFPTTFLEIAVNED